RWAAVRAPTGTHPAGPRPEPCRRVLPSARARPAVPSPLHPGSPGRAGASAASVEATRPARAPAMPALGSFARRYPQGFLDLRDDPSRAFGFKEFLVHLGPSAERVDREQARGGGELAGLCNSFDHRPVALF